MNEQYSAARRPLAQKVPGRQNAATVQRRGKWATVITLLSVGALGGRAFAGYSAITPSNNPTEAGIAEILDHTYGGHFTADGMNYSNGAYTAVRLDDDGDHFFSQSIESARALSTYDGSFSFGYIPGTSGGSYAKLFDTQGNGLDVAGGAGGILVKDQYRLAIGTGTQIFTSQPSDNIGGADHAVTYWIGGAGQTPDQQVWLLGWEDASTGSAFEFNNTVEVRTGPVGGSSPVPAPTALCSGVLSLLGLAFASQFKRFKRAF